MPGQRGAGPADAAVWYVYMVRCRDNTLYTGITTDLQRRLAEHNSPAKGARYTRSRQPVELVFSEQTHSRASAAKREWQLKRLPAPKKEALLRKEAHPAQERKTT